VPLSLGAGLDAAYASAGYGRDIVARRALGFVRRAGSDLRGRYIDSFRISQKRLFIIVGVEIRKILLPARHVLARAPASWTSSIILPQMRV